jgi:hypothetical protein
MDTLMLLMMSSGNARAGRARIPDRPGLAFRLELLLPAGAVSALWQLAWGVRARHAEPRCSTAVRGLQAVMEAMVASCSVAVIARARNYY